MHVPRAYPARSGVERPASSRYSLLLLPDCADSCLCLRRSKLLRLPASTAEQQERMFPLLSKAGKLPRGAVANGTHASDMYISLIAKLARRGRRAKAHLASLAPRSPHISLRVCFRSTWLGGSPGLCPNLDSAASEFASAAESRLSPILPRVLLTLQQVRKSAHYYRGKVGRLHRHPEKQKRPPKPPLSAMANHWPPEISLENSGSNWNLPGLSASGRGCLLRAPPAGKPYFELGVRSVAGTSRVAGTYLISNSYAANGAF